MAPSDNVVQVARRLPRLSKNNSRQWAYGMEGQLRASRLWDIVSGAETRPEPLLLAEDAAKEAIEAHAAASKEVEQTTRDWDANNWAAIVAILEAIETSQYSQVQGVDSARAIRKALQNTLETPSKTRLLEFKREFYRFSIDNMSIDEAVARLTNLRSEIGVLEKALELPKEADILVILLDAVGPDFKTIRTILTSASDLDYSSAIARLKEEELKIAREKGTPTALLAAANRKKPAESRCYECQTIGHFARGCLTRKVRT